ncbi:MAG: DUF4280 domain-containing protein, partial [Lachnospiraceae bacterium]|nr:DUF4280 domain-containing protein [Lachnospiraceae bacterium]
MGEENSKNIGDFTFDKYKEKNYDKNKEEAIELMCRHFEFYGQLDSPSIEYVTRGAKLSCTHGNRYIYLDAARDHGVYDGEDPVLTCKDCKEEENIKNFGACGNGKFEPLYSEEAPHPAQTVLNKNGQQRYVCLPILLGEWGYGDINSRSLLIGEVFIDKIYKVYKKESFDSGELSEDTIEQIAQDQLQNMVEDVEYSQALMKCDNLLCLYGGVITIEENPPQWKRAQIDFRKIFNAGKEKNAEITDEMNEWDSVEDLIDMIGGEKIDDYDQMVQLPTVEILARMIYQENHHVGDEQNRIVFSVVNRICFQDGYLQKDINEEEKVNNLYGIVTSGNQYQSIWNAQEAEMKTEAGKYNAYWVPSDENAVESEKIAWENAKRLAALLYYAVEEYGDGEDTERGKCVG